MISISGKKWEEIKTNKNLVEKIKQDYSFSEIVSKLILTRNFDKEEIFSLLDELNLKNVFSNNNDFKININNSYDVDVSIHKVDKDEENEDSIDIYKFQLDLWMR